MILQVLIARIAGWIQRHQQQVIAYLQEENRVLKAQLGDRRLRLTDTERQRLAALAHPLGRQRLKEMATIATPDTLLRWYKRLITQKFDGSQQRRQLGRPRVDKEVEQLVVRMAAENPTWGYRRIQGALANLGHRIDKLTVRNILRRQHMEPAPQRRKAGMSWAQFLRACLKSSRSGCKTPHHQVDHGDSDPRLGGLRQGLEVFTQPPRAIKPAERTFHDPTPLYDLKTLGMLRAFHDHESPLEHRRHPRDELPSVPPVSPDELQSRETGHECPEYGFGPIAVLDPRRVHHHHQEQPEDIDDNVALAPADALAPVIAPDPPFSVVFTV